MATKALKNLFSLREMKRPLFIPLLYTYAARLAQIPVRRMLTDPAAMTKSISMAYQLFQYDAVVIPFDPLLEAEALGCRINLRPDAPPQIMTHAFSEAWPQDSMVEGLAQQARMPVVMEAIRRLQSLLGKEVALLAGITGPVTMAGHLWGDSLWKSPSEDRQKVLDALEFTGRVGAAMARQYGEMGLGGLVVAEPCFSLAGAEALPGIRASYGPLSNIRAFYELPLVLHVDSGAAGQLDELFLLDWDGLVIHDPSHLKKNRNQAVTAGRCLGAPLAFSNPNSEPKENAVLFLQECLQTLPRTGLFFSTAGDIPLALPPEVLHQVMRHLKKTCN